jgi:hypothetical protein
MWGVKRMRTYVCVSPFGAKNQAATLIATTTKRPTKMLYLGNGQCFNWYMTMIITYPFAIVYI